MRSNDIRRIALGASLTAAVVAASGAAFAAPQALGLVATLKPVELKCEGGLCEAEFSAFCLQPERLAPKSGTPYRLTERSQITLTGKTADGRAHSLPVGELLHINSARTHTAVRLYVDQKRLADLGMRSISVEIAGNVTLSPAPVADDVQPISAAELKMVEEALRPVGSAVVDRNSEGMAAARITNRLVNAIPYYEAEPAKTATLWQSKISQAQNEGLSPTAQRLAQNAFDLCRYYSDRVVRGDMKGCMQGQHDRLMKVLNSSFWKAIRTGS